MTLEQNIDAILHNHGLRTEAEPTDTNTLLPTQEQRAANLANIADLLRRRGVIVTPTSKFPYHSKDIYENINSQAEEDMMNRVLTMDKVELTKFVSDVQLRIKLDKSYLITREHIITGKAAIKRAHDLKQAGPSWSETFRDIINGIGAGHAATGMTRGLTGSALGDYFAARAVSSAMVDQLNKRR